MRTVIIVAKLLVLMSLQSWQVTEQESKPFC